MRSLLVFDGAMGSLLYERGVFVMQNFEQLNVTRPDIVSKIHEDYVAAGAQVIETNTYGANSFRLDRHGLGDQVRVFNAAGARQQCCFVVECLLHSTNSSLAALQKAVNLQALPPPTVPRSPAKGVD